MPKNYEGDGQFTDLCGSNSWSFGGRERYTLDLGELDLSQTKQAEFRVGSLPEARLWLVGLNVKPRGSRPAGAELDDAVVRLVMTNAEGAVVISESAPLSRWQWQLVGTLEEGIGPSFVYLAGKNNEIPLRGGGVRLDPIKKADGGWGTYFEPRPGRRFNLRVQVVQPDPDASNFSVHLVARGNNYVGSP